MISKETIEQVLMRNDIVSLIGSYVSLKRAGSNLKGLCPFHSEKSPSFTVYPQDNSFYCFGCGAGGDAITFVRKRENLDYTDAVEFLANRAGITIVRDELGGYQNTPKFDRARIFKMNADAARYFHRRLFDDIPEAKKALAYFTNERKLSISTIKHFGLGYAPNSFDKFSKYMRGLGYTYDELVAGFLCGKNEERGTYFDAFRNRVMFPIIDVSGNVIAFGGRVLDDSKPKYKNSSDTPVFKKSRNLFALNFARHAGTESMILCEGYMDVIALHGAGFENAVAGLGTALTPEQVSLISRYADEVALCYDSDEAGQKAVRAAINLFSKTGVRVKVIKLQGGKDPDEIIRSHGKESFAKLLNTADNDTEYKLSVIRSKYDVDTPDGKVNFLREAATFLAGADALGRDVYAMRLSDELGVSKDAILQHIKEAAKREHYRKAKTEFSDAQKKAQEMEKNVDPQRVKNMRAARAEDTILITLLNNGSFYNSFKDRLKSDVFFTPVNKRIFEIISERLENRESIDIAHLSQFLTSDETGAVARLLSRQSMVSNTVKECEDCLKVLEEEKRKRETSDPSQMSDDSFLAFFSSLNKDE